MTRLSSHLPHLHRLCRLDRLSVRSKRLAAVLAAVLLTLSLVTLPLFAAAEQNHACAREHCAICAQYQQLRQSTGAAPAPAAEPPALPRPPADSGLSPVRWEPGCPVAGDAPGQALLLSAGPYASQEACRKFPEGTPCGRTPGLFLSFAGRAGRGPAIRQGEFL